MVRLYTYLLPAEIIGIKGGCTSAEIEDHVSDFNDILKGFEVPFHCCCLDTFVFSGAPFRYVQ